MKLALLAASALAIVVADTTAQRRGGDPSTVWKTLSERYDKDKDGKLTKEEYVRREQKFAKWDSNKDGVITAADFASGGGRNRAGRDRTGGNRNRQMDARTRTMVLGMLFATPADDDKNGKVTTGEWKKFCEKLDCDKNGIVTRDEMPNAETLNDRMFAAAVQASDKDKDGKIQLPEVARIFGQLDADKSSDLKGDEISGTRGRGNRGGRNRGGGNRGNRPLEAGVPRVGEAAPDFDLPLVDQVKGAKSEATIKLSSFAGKKPVALIFGSYT